MYSSLLTVEQAQEQLLSQLDLLAQSESCSLHEACWRVLSEDITSNIDSPPCNVSMMDGYAIALNTTPSNEHIFKVTQRVPAGSVPTQALKEGETARIFTGAMLPPGADTVIMQEATELTPEGIRVTIPIKAGQHIRYKGEEIKAGQTLLKAGTRLSPAAIGLCASVGIAQLPVYRTLSIALLVTGSELVEPGMPLAAGQIYNSNLYLLESLIRAHGYNVVCMGIVADTLSDTVNCLRNAAHFDAIISTGGVSVGEEDHVRNAVNQLGHIDSWRVSMKPGKPFTFGRVLETPFFGLPGNPVAAFTCFHLFALPALRRLQGLTDMIIEAEPATADFNFRAGDRREYLRARLVTQLGQRVAQIYPTQGSAVLASTVWAEGFIEVQEGTSIKPGDRVAFIPFNQFRQ